MRVHRAISLVGVILMLGLPLLACQPTQDEEVAVQTEATQSQPAEVVVEEGAEITTVETVIVEQVVQEQPLPTEERAESEEFDWHVAIEQDAAVTIGVPTDAWDLADGALDPHRARREEAIWILEQCLSTPLRDSGYELVPDAASSWVVSDDGLEYTIHLDPQRIWSTGEPVRSEDFRHGMLHSLAPETGAPYAPLLFGIEGARDYNQGHADVDGVGLRVLDDSTFRIRMEEPDYDFALILTTPAAWPMREDFDYSVDPERLPDLPCNGYFVVDNYVPGQEILLARFDDQPGANDVSIQQATFAFMWDDAATLEAFESDELDAAWLQMAPNEALQDFAWAAHNLRSVPSQGFWALIFNVHSESVADAAFRRALVQATPLDVVESLADTGLGTPVESLLPDSEEPALLFDPDSAREELSAANYNGQPLTILAPAFAEEPLAVLQMIAPAWRAILDVTTEMTVVSEYADYAEDVDLCTRSPVDCPYDMVLRWLVPMAPHDPRGDALLRPFSSSHWEPQLGGWSDSDFDLLLDGASRALSAEERYEFLSDAQDQILAKNPAFIRLYRWINYDLWDSDMVRILTLRSRKTPLRNTVKLEKLTLDELGELTGSLLTARRDYQEDMVDGYHTNANAAIRALGDWAPGVKLPGEVEAETVKDAASVLTSLAGQGSRADAIAGFILKRLLAKAKGDLQKNLVNALDELQKEIEEDANTTKKANEEKTKSDLADLGNEFAECRKLQSDPSKKKEYEEARKRLDNRIKELIVESQATVVPKLDGKGWTVVKGTANAPRSKAIQGEFLCKLDELLSGDLWRENTKHPIWPGYDSPALPANYTKRYYWQSRKHQAIAEELMRIEYWKDIRKPRHKFSLLWPKAFLVTDYESGLEKIEVDWVNSQNVVAVTYTPWKGKKTRVTRPAGNKTSVLPNSKPKGFYGPAMIIVIEPEVRGKTSRLKCSAWDADGNMAEMFVER